MVRWTSLSAGGHEDPDGGSGARLGAMKTRMGAVGFSFRMDDYRLCSAETIQPYIILFFIFRMWGPSGSHEDQHARSGARLARAISQISQMTEMNEP